MPNVTQLIETLYSKGITDTSILEAIRAIPRECFLPDEWRDHAYDDSALPLASGQTISQPYVVAKMIILLLRGQKLKKVLEIGTGWGYQAAVLSRLVEKLYTIERIQSLANQAQQRLKPYPNVVCRFADGYEGWLEESPFDGIIVAAAAKEVPQALLSQLNEGGRLVIPVGDSVHQQLFMIEKKGGKTIEHAFDLVKFVPLLSGTD